MDTTNNTETVAFELTRADLQVIFQALCLADAYYADPNRKVAGMHSPTTSTVVNRRLGIAPLIRRITDFSAGLS